jgi:hypothetical protein
LEAEYRRFRLVGQAKSDRTMLCLQPTRLKWDPVPSKDVNTDTAPSGLIMHSATQSLMSKMGLVWGWIGIVRTG